MADDKNEEVINYQERFPGVWGQERILKRLSFLLDIQNNSGFLPPILITGQLGAGKNILGNALCRNLLGPEKNHPKKAILINCSTFENLNDFFDNLILPHVIDREVSIILDEIHCLHGTNIIDALLSIWNSDEYINYYTYNNIIYSFDLRRISWIALTSEPHLLPKTLKSRMEIMELEELKLNDLARIVNKKLKDFEIENQDLLLDIASYGRKNGREAFRLGQMISEFLKNSNKNRLTYDDWRYVKNQLGILPDGISTMELRIMNYLKQNGPSTLTKLSSALQLTSNATRQGFEGYLLANNYLEIIPKGRQLTYKGAKYLEEVQE